MKLTHDNLKEVFDAIEQNMEDENGRGEFDTEMELIDAVEIAIERLGEEQ